LKFLKNINHYTSKYFFDESGVRKRQHPAIILIRIVYNILLRSLRKLIMRAHKITRTINSAVQFSYPALTLRLKIEPFICWKEDCA